MTINASFYDVE